MKAYKGFDKNLQCRGFQFESGKDYKEERAELCNCGFHACENPIDTFGYYPPADSRYCEVELDEVEDKTDNDSNRCGKRIHIGVEIGLRGIIETGVKFILDRVDWKNAKESNTGNWSAATNTGYQSAATNTGYQSAATNTGDRSAATNTGNWSAATNTGDRSAANVTGKGCLAAVTGRESRAAASIGSGFVICEHDDNGNLVKIHAAVVDGVNIKADTYYMVKDGELVEAEE